MMIRSIDLDVSRPNLAIVVVESGFSYCLVISSAYILFLLLLFLHVSVFLCMHWCQMTYIGCSLDVNFWMFCY